MLLLELTTPAKVDGSGGADSTFILLAGVLNGLLLFSDPVKSDGILLPLRLLISVDMPVGVPARDGFLDDSFGLGFFFLSSFSESLLSELKSLEESKNNQE